MRSTGLMPHSRRFPGKPTHVVLAGAYIKSEEDLISLLRQNGLVPVPSSSLKEAQFLLERKETAIAICHASSSDGSFRDILRAARDGSKVPVIVCADVYDPHLYLEAMDLGAFDYFTYPYYKDGVEWVVGNALGQARKSKSKQEAEKPKC